eukprot:TRINITY_DN14148_c0_g1_i4.p1 TRINITY_DN14148_c0_g1~~TRINITY_DN14148_c0_g1_i4.p1  ORF type:complete len:100 (-),score=7.35 TRINITY_DN14148_c0_g1_i4:432-731(-)
MSYGGIWISLHDGAHGCCKYDTGSTFASMTVYNCEFTFGDGGAYLLYTRMDVRQCWCAAIRGWKYKVLDANFMKFEPRGAQPILVFFTQRNKKCCVKMG